MQTRLSTAEKITAKITTECVQAFTLELQRISEEVAVLRLGEGNPPSTLRRE